MGHNPLELNFPDHHIWTYCVYLGPYDYKGRKFDLGVYVDPQGHVSNAIVYGGEDNEYLSGGLDYEWSHPAAIETKKRWEMLR